MNIEEQLKREILMKYRSIRAFTMQLEIPYSTLDSVFKRGVANAGVSTMIKVFNALDLDIESIQSGILQHKFPASTNQMTLSSDEWQFVNNYRSLNEQGQELARQQMELLTDSDKYKKSCDISYLAKESGA